MFIFYIGIPDKSLTYLLFKKVLFGVIWELYIRAWPIIEGLCYKWKYKKGKKLALPSNSF